MAVEGKGLGVGQADPITLLGRDDRRRCCSPRHWRMRADLRRVRDAGSWIGGRPFVTLAEAMAFVFNVPVETKATLLGAVPELH
ncbi:MAG: hypothetical protein OXH76_19405 [Boseongicola sp.]|nr:hypothetical protein [Boseongicola sp.]